jgi:Zn ribbon nucleic-acid-binding protein
MLQTRAIGTEDGVLLLECVRCGQLIDDPAILEVVNRVWKETLSVEQTTDELQALYDEHEGCRG